MVIFASSIFSEYIFNFTPCTSLTQCFKKRCSAPPGFDDTRTDFFLANTKSCGPHTATYHADDFFGTGDSYRKPSYKLYRFIKVGIRNFWVCSAQKGNPYPTGVFPAPDNCPAAELFFWNTLVVVQHCRRRCLARRTKFCPEHTGNCRAKIRRCWRHPR